MKLKLKTLDHRDFSIEFDDTKTIWELKKHICRLRGMWLHPESQRLLYAGQVLNNWKQVRSYCIDERKFLLMLPERTPSYPLNRESSAALLKSSSLASTSASSSAFASASTSLTSSTASCSSLSSSVGTDTCVLPMYIPTEKIREQIMKLGPWTEAEVGRALLISLNNPNRAINYLLSEKAPFPKMVTPPSSRVFLTASNLTIKNGTSRPMSPIIRNLHPVNDSDKRAQKATKNQVHFEKNKKSVKYAKTVEILNDIQRLADIGLPYNIAQEVYHASNGDVEMAGALIFEQYIDEINRKRCMPKPF